MVREQLSSVIYLHRESTATTDKRYGSTATTDRRYGSTKIWQYYNHRQKIWQYCNHKQTNADLRICRQVLPASVAVGQFDLLVSPSLNAAKQYTIKNVLHFTSMKQLQSFTTSWTKRTKIIATRHVSLDSKYIRMFLPPWLRPGYHWSSRLQRSPGLLARFGVCFAARREGRKREKVRVGS